jgi:hypothetical protein
VTIASNLSFLQNSVGAVTTGTINALGTPITFGANSTEYNRIDSNGYSLLGYTTSQGAYKLQVLGNIFAGGLTVTTATITNLVATVTTATNLSGGTAGQLVYAQSASLTGFAGPGTAGQVLVSGGSSAPVYQSTLALAGTTGATSTTTGALTVAGGVGIGGKLYVGGMANSTSSYIVYINTTTFELSYGVNSGGGSGGAGISGGTAGQLVYMSAPNVTAFAGPGTAGQILVSAGTSAPSYTNTTSIQVGYAANILGNGAGNGSLVYQSSANTTAFLGQGSAGWLLVSGGSGSNPAFTSTGSIYVNSAVNSNNIIGGSTNQIPYQSGAGATTFNSGFTFNGTTFNAPVITQNGVAISTATNVPPAGTAKTSSYTLATTDVGKFVELQSGASLIIPNSTFSAGDIITVVNNTTGNITVTTNPTSTYIAGVNTTKSSVTLYTRGMLSVFFINGTTCLLTGNIA